MLNIVMFSTSTCVHCKPVKALLDKQENIDVSYVVIDKQEDGRALASEWGVQGVPTLLYIREGECLTRSVGSITQEKLNQVLSEIGDSKNVESTEVQGNGCQVDPREV